MIAHDSRGTPEDARLLSGAIAQRLRDAIRARWRARDSAETERAVACLATALADAAAEARERALHPEELILAIKALEADVSAERADFTPGQRRALRAWLVTACIRAYFDVP
ncbi:MAG: hypothetical protein ABR499_10440 [Gemmatimonadaceae bacterium]